MNEDVIPLLDAAAKEMDTEKLKEIYSDLQELGLTDLPAIPLFYGASWYEFSTAHWVGWPREEDPRWLSPYPWNLPNNLPLYFGLSKASEGEKPMPSWVTDLQIPTTKIYEDLAVAQPTIVVPATASDEEGHFSVTIDAGAEKGAPVSDWTEIITANIASYTVTLTDGNMRMVVTGQLQDPDLEGKIVLEVDPDGEIITYEITIAPYIAPKSTTLTVDTDPRTVDKIGSETTKIFGCQKSGETGLGGKTVKLYYQYASTEYGYIDGTWTHIASVTTDTGGYYEHYWNPDDTLENGYYCIKGEFEGDPDYQPCSATTGVDLVPNLFVIPEYALGTILGLAACIAALAVFKSRRVQFTRLQKIDRSEN